MRRLAAIALVAAVCLVPAATGSAGGASPSSAVAAAKKCGKHKRKHHKHRRGHRRCRKPGTTGGGTPGPGEGAAPCTNTATSPGRAAAFESEYSIHLSRASVGCGKVILEQNTTSAMDPHDLVLQKAGDASPSYTYDELGPGGVASKTLDLTRGNWVLYCSLLDHRARGMEVTLSVN